MACLLPSHPGLLWSHPALRFYDRPERTIFGGRQDVTSLSHPGDIEGTSISSRPEPAVRTPTVGRAAGPRGWVNNHSETRRRVSRVWVLGDSLLGRTPKLSPYLRSLCGEWASSVSQVYDSPLLWLMLWPGLLCSSPPDTSRLQALFTAQGTA